MLLLFLFFFFNDTATTEIYTLSLHDALPILGRFRHAARALQPRAQRDLRPAARRVPFLLRRRVVRSCQAHKRSEEHTSELQSRQYLVCRLLLEKKKNTSNSSLCSKNRNYLAQ